MRPFIGQYLFTSALYKIRNRGETKSVFLRCWAFRIPATTRILVAGMVTDDATQLLCVWSLQPAEHLGNKVAARSLKVGADPTRRVRLVSLWCDMPCTFVWRALAANALYSRCLFETSPLQPASRRRGKEALVLRVHFSPARRKAKWYVQLRRIVVFIARSEMQSDFLKTEKG